MVPWCRAILYLSFRCIYYLARLISSILLLSEQGLALIYAEYQLEKVVLHSLWKMLFLDLNLVAV